MKNIYDMMPPVRDREKLISKKTETETKKDPIKEKIIQLFLDKGILQKDGEKWLFDYAQYQEANITAKPIDLGRENGERRTATASVIFEKLKDLKVLPVADNNKSDEPLPLFNIPQSVDEAFDPEKIATKKYVLNFWDLYQSIQRNQVTAENGEQIKTLDLVFATKLFHDFQAKRINGKLIVLDPQKKEMVKVSLEWLVKNIGVDGLEKSIHGFLRDNCPNLLAKGLVKYEDFSVKSAGASGALIRQEKIMGNTTSSSASFDGVQYYIGKKQFNFDGKSYPTNKLKVVLLDKNTGGVVAIDNGKEKIICIFDFISQEEKEAKHDQLE